MRLALSMGFENKEEFRRRLEEHRSIVHRHFSMLLEPKHAKQSPGGRGAELEEIWQGALPSGRGEKILSATGYQDPAGAVRLLAHLREDLAGRSLGREGRDRLNKLIPLLLEAAGKCDEPLITLNRIVDLIKAIEGRAAYLALLLENPSCLVHLVRLTSASSLIATFLARHPVLLDELLDPRTLYAPPGRNDLEKELRLRLERLSEDLEYQMEELRVFKQVSVLRVAAADVTQVLPLMRVSDHLTDIAEVVLNEVLELAWDYLTAKHGKPTCELKSGEPCERGFAVIAYGKLGGLELGYGSDLDLVFLHSGSSGQTDSNRHPIDNNHFFARLGQRVLHLLTAATRAGILYDTDMRLRPSGSSGILVSHIEGFRDYQLNDAWTWEHQALIRARAVGGDIRLKQEFADIRRQVLSLPRNRQKLHQEVVQMRRRMRRELLKPESGIFQLKQDTGGIVDIEFLVQYLVLLKSHEFPALLEWTDNVRLIQTLIETGVIDEYRAHLLKHAYLIYRAMAHKLSLQEKPARVPEEKFQNLRRKVAEIWKSTFGTAE
jgi:glutamate-ammonia-ligase adenylyltransferase